MIHVTAHACERFIERVAACTLDQAREDILSHSRALETAIEFGAEIVKLGDGSRLILQGNRVVTVQAAHMLPRQCRSPFYPSEDEQPL